ncbi:MAG: CoA-binding protein [Bacillota bacterium]|nr:CoA-binding protein [Bacillota bacterium]MDW7677345.1 CoA-binding protein [Bacillota bacterium]
MDQIKENKKNMLALKKWVVVGATPNEEKFGYKIFKTLKSHHYEVWGVNPNYRELEGETIYQDLSSLPQKPDCVSVVVPPPVSMKLVEEVADQGIEYIWFQPGTFNNEVLKKAQELKLKSVYNDCVLVTLGH